MTTQPTHTQATHHTQPAPRRWLALAALSVAQFMLILDVTVVNVALPDIRTDLGLSRETLTWVVTAYTLAFGGLMLLGGRLADLFGARRVLLTGLVIFTAASLMSGLADNAGVLLAGRAAQGVGAALLSPAALSVVTTSFHGKQRNRALGIWAALGGTGSAVGVLLGGALTAGPGWPWIFFVNVPVGIAVAIALPALVPARPPAGRQRVDLAGALLVTAATAALIYGLNAAGDNGWSAPIVLVPIAGAALLYAGFGIVERRVRAPLMRVQMLTRRPVVTGALLMLVATALLIAAFFLGSFALQHHYAYSALATGLAFLPVAVGTIIGAQAASQLASHVGGRPIAVTGLLIAAGGAAIAAYSAGATTLTIGISVAATGLGATFVAATTTALAQVDHAHAGLASGIVNTSHELGGAVGVATVSSLAAASLAGTTMSGFTTAFTFSAVAALAAAVIAAMFAPGGKPPAGVMPHAH
jgi:EmrB/QacA subfamily drug resistance transporter